MRWIDILCFSAKNILSGGRKAVLSILAVAVGIFSLCLISGMGDTAAAEIEARVSETGLGGLTVYPAKSGQHAISEEDLAHLSADIAGLKAVTPFSVETGTLSCRGKTQPAALIGVGAHISDVFDLRLLYGSYFTAADLAGSQPVILIDDALAQKLYERRNITGKLLTFSVNGVRFEAKIVGIIASQKQGLESIIGVSLPSLVYIPYTFLNQITGHTKTDQIAISCFSAYDENAVADQVIRYLTLQNQVKYKCENLNAYISGLQEILQILQVFIRAVAGISLLVGGIGITNSMFYTVDARRSDIGVCKALGEPKHSILLRFLTEAVILCLLGGILGLFMTELTVSLIEHYFTVYLQIPTHTIQSSLSLALFCGVLSGLLPAYKAAALDPIDVIVR